MKKTFNSKYSRGLNHSLIGSQGELCWMQIRWIWVVEVKLDIWNMQILYEAEKLANLMQEMWRLNVDILGVVEMWWPDAVMCNVPGGIKEIMQTTENEEE